MGTHALAANWGLSLSFWRPLTAGGEGRERARFVWQRPIRCNPRTTITKRRVVCAKRPVL